MKWGRRKKHVREEKNTTTPVDSPSSASPRRSLFSPWLSKFMKSGRQLQDPEREDSLPSSSKSCLPVIVEDEEEGAMEFHEVVSNARQTREHFAGIELNFRERETGRSPREASRQLPNGQDRESPPEDHKLQWKSLRRRSRRVKVRSPRLTSAAVNVRQSKKWRGEGGRHGERDRIEREDYERYALVKCSYDPQEDFKESMMEMIAARGIGGAAAEMEELLASYLILNDDAYHGVIIEVFRQVWFELGDE